MYSKQNEWKETVLYISKRTSSLYRPMCTKLYNRTFKLMFIEFVPLKYHLSVG